MKSVKLITIPTEVKDVPLNKCFWFDGEVYKVYDHIPYSRYTYCRRLNDSEWFKFSIHAKVYHIVNVESEEFENV